MTDPRVDVLPIGETASFSKTVGEVDVYLFAGISGDFHPNHINEEYMKGTRYGTRIAHGALLVAYVSAATRLLAERIPPPGCVSFRYDIRFVAPVRIGDTVTATVKVSNKNEEKREIVLDATVTRQDGVVAAVGQSYLRLI